MYSVKKQRKRRIIAVVAAFVAVIGWVVANPESYESVFTKVENDGAESGIVEDASDDAASSETSSETSSDASAETSTNSSTDSSAPLATEVLELLEVKGRAPKTGYSRDEFYSTWPIVDGCSLRQRIIKRELGDTAVLDGCNVIAGEYTEPYTGEYRILTSKEDVTKIQIDHVVALSDAWQKGAQYFDSDTRYALATDPLNLLAVDGSANQQKSDGDAATWLPSNKAFRCQYVARQVSVKYKYSLWVTEAEKTAILNVLTSCPNEKTVGIEL